MYMKRIAITAVILLLPLSLHALALESIDVKGGLIWIGNAPVAAPDPFLATTGVSVPIRFASFFLLAPELRYIGIPYAIEYGRPVPVEMEFMNSVFVLGFLLEPRALFDFQITDSFSLGAYLSPSFLIRIPGKVWDNGERAPIAAYQYGMGRFFYPEAGLTVDWKLPFSTRSAEAEAMNNGEFTDPPPYEGIDIHLVVDLNAYFPLFHAWDGEGLPFYDQFMASGVVGLRFFLPN